MSTAQGGDKHALALSNTPPAKATEAVLMASSPVPKTLQVIKGMDFDAHQGDVTINELVGAMASTGFQASAVADAVKIINDMVGLGDLK